MSDETPRTRRLRLLIVAPTCDGEDVGEAWLAFQWVERLAAQHDVTLLTYHKRGKTPAREQLRGLRVVEWTEPALLGRAERFNSMLNPGYIAFYLRARQWINRALRSGVTFDLCHQISPVAMRYPSPASGLALPLVLGPVGGSLSSPVGFASSESSSAWFTRLRALDRMRLRFDPLLRSTYTGAACVLGIAPYVADHLADIGVHRFEVMSDTAVGALPDVPARAGTSTTPGLKLLFVGRLVRTKGARDAIRAMADLADLDAVLDVVGDGPDRDECEQLARELDLGTRVVFHGSVTRQKVDDFYQSADVFVFPSYREAGGSVVWEAMSHGLPLIVVNRGGPASSANERCAVLLEASTPEALAADIAKAVRTLASDPDARRRMGAASRERVRQVGTWDSKVQQMNEIYASLV